MTNFNDNRVLCRRGAREMTVSETEHVNGGYQLHTNVCTGFNPATHTGADGDGCSGDIDNS
jgi:hypothetical protein